MTRFVSDHNFESRGPRPRAEAIVQQRSGHGNHEAEHRYPNDDDPKSPAFHAHTNMLTDESRSGQRPIPC